MVTLENELLRATFKEQGAELCSLRRKDHNLEYIWQGDPDIWGRHAPVLFPIVGKLRANQYSYEGNRYHLPQHGFGRDMQWQIADKNTDTISFRLQDDAETRENYPFSFEFIINYHLKGDQLLTTYLIKNTGEQEMLFSVGGHPAFVCPLKEGEQFSDYYLQFETVETAKREMLEHGLRTGEEQEMLKNQATLALSHDLFRHDALIFKNLKSGQVALRSRKHDHGVALSFNGFPYLGVWSKAGDAPFVSIEPWFGLADKKNTEGELGTKEGIQKLQPQASFEAGFEIKAF